MLDLTSLPPNLDGLYIWDNPLLTGTIDLTSLPQWLTTLHLDDNNLNGTLDLAHLPRTLYGGFLFTSATIRIHFASCILYRTFFKD